MFGFGFSKEKSRASAEKYLQQNKLPQAISEYEKILKVEPRDLAILNHPYRMRARDNIERHAGTELLEDVDLRRLGVEKVGYRQRVGFIPRRLGCHG